VYGAVVCSYDAVSLFYLELYVKLSIYLSIGWKKKNKKQNSTVDASKVIVQPDEDPVTTDASGMLFFTAVSLNASIRF
jgi:hypothetical protein